MNKINEKHFFLTNKMAQYSNKGIFFQVYLKTYCNAQISEQYTWVFLFFSSLSFPHLFPLPLFGWGKKYDI